MTTGRNFRPKASKFATAPRSSAPAREQRRNEMPVKVMIPTPLRPYAGKRASAEFQAATVGEALGHLTKEFVDLRKHLFTNEGKLRSFVNVYVKDDDTISIVPSIAGGVS